MDRVRDPFDIDWSRPYDVGSAQISYQTRTGNPRQCSTLLSYGPQNVRTLRSQPCERSDQNQRPTVLTVLTSVSHPATETTPPEVGLFMHKWRTDLLSSEVLGPAETVALKTKRKCQHFFKSPAGQYPDTATFHFPAQWHYLPCMIFLDTSVFQRCPHFLHILISK